MADIIYIKYLINASKHQYWINPETICHYFQQSTHEEADDTDDTEEVDENEDRDIVEESAENDVAKEKGATKDADKSVSNT